jgi:Uma2 family endonuclease
MTPPPETAVQPRIEYPDDDGLPMADNSLQYHWIVTIQGNLAAVYRHETQVCVIGNMLWYPVEGHPEIRTAPDVMVVFGRPKIYRGSYKQWLEEGIAPQVVFEVLSPGNRPEEMDRKFGFYEEYGVEEYYLYDPDAVEMLGWQRTESRLQALVPMHNHISRRLGIRFDLSGEELAIYGPDGRRFRTMEEFAENEEQAQQLAEHERLAREQAQLRAEKERLIREEAQTLARLPTERAEQECQRAEQERQRAERLTERLRSLGIDPDA